MNARKKNPGYATWSMTKRTVPKIATFSPLFHIDFRQNMPLDHYSRTAFKKSRVPINWHRNFTRDKPFINANY